MEKALREVQEAGRSGKTLQNYRETICAFCDWAVARGYLSDDPLKNSTAYDTSPRSKRRTLTPDEIQRLLDVAPDYRSLLYQVAMCTGLRANELRSLKVRDLNTDMKALNLHAEWTKNRKPGLQPIPLWLLERLEVVSRGKALDDPLLRVPRDVAPRLDKDLKAADISKWTPLGKIDFHALRSVYVSNVIEAGTTVKEAQSLARHSTPALTMNTYAKASQKRLTELTEKASEIVKVKVKCALCVHQQETTDDEKNDFGSDIIKIGPLYRWCERGELLCRPSGPQIRGRGGIWKPGVQLSS